MTRWSIAQAGLSRSFPEPHRLVSGAVADADVLVYLGAEAGKAFRPDDSKRAILVELATECLGVWTGESRGTEGSNVLGFARWRVGDDAPSDLVELVRQPATSEDAVAAAKAVLADAGLEAAVCGDFAGRILDRLIRPYFNEALNRLDQRLASADDLDLTLRLGLGYPVGPIALLERSGLAHHHDVTQALFETYGEKAYAPARRAVVAKRRQGNADKP